MKRNFSFRGAGRLALTLAIIFTLGQSAMASEFAWSTYLGGSGHDRGHAIVMDAIGNVYITGETTSAGWITGDLDTTLNGTSDAFVSKFTAEGQLVWSTYLGGDGTEIGWGIALDSDGYVCVTGETTSSEWASGGYDLEYGESTDGFIARLSPEGQMVWSSYLGSYDIDQGQNIAIDDEDNIYVIGMTRSNNWVSGGYDTTLTGTYNGFVVKLSSAGLHLWSSFVASSCTLQAAMDIALDSEQNIYITGGSDSDNWVSGGYDTTKNGNADAYLIKLSPTGDHLWSTLMGGQAIDQGLGITVDPNDNVLVTGRTKSSDWVSGGYDTTKNEFQDAFLVKISAEGGHLWSTYLGGNSNDLGFDIATNDAGRIYILGDTQSPSWAEFGYDTVLNAYGDVFLMSLSAEGVPIWNTYLGGESNDYAGGIAVNAASEVYAVGMTQSDDWVENGADTVRDGGYDAFITKILDGPDHQTGTLTVTIEPSEAIDAGAQWRLTDDTEWRNSGEPLNLVLTGDHVIEYKSINGWSHPTNQEITIETSVVTEKIGLYEQKFGSLQVTILPEEAVTAGAQWRRTGTSQWHDSGMVETDVPVNDYAIEFRSIVAWATPINVPANVEENLTAQLEINYRATAMLTGIAWGEYAGGLYSENGMDIAIDPNGNILLAGDTRSADWVTGGYDTSLGGDEDNFLAKYDATGTLLWSTYLGGDDDLGHNADVAVDSMGNIYVSGSTDSTDWLAAINDISPMGGREAFVVKLTPEGVPIWAICLGGAKQDECEDIATDPQGNVYITGRTYSPDWISGGYSSTYSDGWDIFVLKISPEGQTIWGTYLGGLGSDVGSALEVSALGNVFVTGSTHSSDWMIGGSDTTFHGGDDIFVTKLTSDGQHVWSMGMGDQWDQVANDIALDVEENIYLTGSTEIFSTWANGGVDSEFNGGTTDAFAAKIATDSHLIWSTYLGGNCTEFGQAIILDAQGNLCITGSTCSGDWAVGGFNTVVGGNYDAFVAMYSPQGEHLWSALMGGTYYDSGMGLAQATTGDIYLAGSTGSPDWLTGIEDNVFSGIQDAFILMLQASYTGSLTVTIEPPEAVEAGAQWRRAVTEDWMDSEMTETPVVIGDYTLELKAIEGWEPPASIDISITHRQTTTPTVTYEKQTAVGKNLWIIY